MRRETEKILKSKGFFKIFFLEFSISLFYTPFRLTISSYPVVYARFPCLRYLIVSFYTI